MPDRLVGELLDAMNNRGGSVKKKMKFTAWRMRTKRLHIIDFKTVSVYWLLSTKNDKCIELKLTIGN